MSMAELIEARETAAHRSWPVMFLGGGSNLLVSDEGFPGLVVRYGDRSVRIEPIGVDDALVTAGARSPLAGLARSTARAGWAGLEWSEGIPGTVAGAVVGNAGAYGGEMAGAVASVDVFDWGNDGTLVVWPAERLAYAYRDSVFKRGAAPQTLILSATLRLRRGDPAHLESEIRRIAEERRRKTPAGATCGSVFRNPPGDYAGRLIEAAGCKAMRSGSAVVSEQHANYIINEGGARASDVLDLIARIRSRVLDRFAVSLALEIQLVGFAPGDRVTP
jgi:UDP-N-acetylmuramate dehydrogenase